MSRPNYLNETGPYDTRAEAAGALMPRAAHALAAQARDHVESKEAAVNVTYDMLTAACQAGDVDLGRFDAEALRWIAEHADVEVAQALLGMVFRVGKADAGAVQRLVAYRNDVVSQRDRTRNMLADLVAGVGQALEQPELHEVESGALLDLDRLLTDARTVLASLPPRVQLGDLQPGDELAGPGSSLCWTCGRSSPPNPRSLATRSPST